MIMMQLPNSTDSRFNKLASISTLLYGSFLYGKVDNDRSDFDDNLNEFLHVDVSTLLNNIMIYIID